MVSLQQLRYRGEGLEEKMGVVRDKLHRGIDFVCHSCCQTSDGFEFLCELELDFEAAALVFGPFSGGDVSRNSKRSNDCAIRSLEG
ncbi:MAG: hypothetical protein BWY82_02726 [Verrucomicrobia bacterium ADurb.Bin474]|nr:MAG: hypothetical protein BWY82_02726 [Verrucomicrobia bacterium ADurb.Bin474]